MDKYKRVTIGGMATIVTTRKELAELMLNDCLSSRNSSVKTIPKAVFSSNGQGIALYGQDPNFRNVMDKADIIHADGMSVVYGSKLCHTTLPERIATTDFFHDAAKIANENQLSFYILGGKKKQNEEVVKQIRSLYPNIRISGNRDGYFDHNETINICEDIVNSKTDVLWVALGKPKQEFWVIENMNYLKGIGWIKTCGGLYSFLTNDVKRAPQWMQNLGLEWLFRSLQEPKRLGWRYIITNPYAFFRILFFSK